MRTSSTLAALAAFAAVGNALPLALLPSTSGDVAKRDPLLNLGLDADIKIPGLLDMDASLDLGLLSNGQLLALDADIKVDLLGLSVVADATVVVALDVDINVAINLDVFNPCYTPVPGGCRSCYQDASGQLLDLKLLALVLKRGGYWYTPGGYTNGNALLDIKIFAAVLQHFTYTNGQYKIRRDSLVNIDAQVLVNGLLTLDIDLFVSLFSDPRLCNSLDIKVIVLLLVRVAPTLCRPGTLYLDLDVIVTLLLSKYDFVPGCGCYRRRTDSAILGVKVLIDLLSTRQEWTRLPNGSWTRGKELLWLDVDSVVLLQNLL